MKKIIILCAVVFIVCACGKKPEPKTVEAPKVVFALFSGYRCPPCMVFEDEYLDNFEKIYNEKYNGRVELQIYKVDIPFNITPDSPEYAEAKKLAQRNDAILKATGKLNNVKYIGSLPCAVIGATLLDGSTDDTEVNGPNVERAIDKALANNETTILATGVSGKMQDYANISQAVRAGDYKAVEAFLNKGVSPNEGEEISGGSTPLMLAAFNGDEDIIKLLLSRGADINARDKQDGTAIDTAAFMGRTELVEFMLSKGATITADTIASSGLDEHMIALLKKHGADINGTIPDGNTPLTRVLTHREKMSGTKIALKYAGVLITQGADVNKKVTIKDDNGKTVTKTPLQLAQSKEMKDFLISKGAK
ncbi:MAG: ankyrin repeat domain-containing protein [Elusimicrobia bacterium]|nr:ankyrin repeat domain-containing protein [Elusimicrobiota bacterium]